MKQNFTTLLAAGAIAFACIATSGVTTADAGTKKNTSKSAKPSKDQKAKVFKWALAQCRKRHGSANVHHVEINYTYNRYVCWVER